MTNRRRQRSNASAQRVNTTLSLSTSAGQRATQGGPRWAATPAPRGHTSNTNRQGVPVPLRWIRVHQTSGEPSRVSCPRQASRPETVSHRRGRPADRERGGNPRFHRPNRLPTVSSNPSGPDRPASWRRRGRWRRYTSGCPSFPWRYPGPSGHSPPGWGISSKTSLITVLNVDCSSLLPLSWSERPAAKRGRPRPLSGTDIAIVLALT